MNQRYYVLCVKRYDFKDDSGKRIVGVKITYIDESDIQNTNTAKGNIPLSISSPEAALWNSFSVVPHYYQLDFGIKPGKDSKPTLYLKGAKLLDTKAA